MQLVLSPLLEGFLRAFDGHDGSLPLRRTHSTRAVAQICVPFLAGQLVGLQIGSARLGGFVSGLDNLFGTPVTHRSQVRKINQDDQVSGRERWTRILSGVN